MDLEEELEDVPEGDPLRVEDDFDRLGVTGMVGIGRVLARNRSAVLYEAAVSRCGSFQSGRGKWQV